MISEGNTPPLKIEWLLTAVVLLCLSYALTAHLIERDHLRKYGRTIKAVVTDSDEGETGFYTEYLFRVNGTSIHSATSAMKLNLNKGDSLSILYLPDDPHINEALGK